MIRKLGDVVINVYSDINNWIDYIFILDDERDYDEAVEIISKAYDDWFSILDDGVNDIPISEYISEHLKEAGISGALYIIDLEEEA